MRQANAAKDQFLATLNHELRTPLTLILVAARLLAERTDNPKGAREHVGSVADAIRVGKERTFDIVLCDLGLSDGSGIEVARALVSSAPVKAIALTGFGMESDVQRSLDAGFTAHLTKPVDLDSLHDLISRL